MTQPSNFKPRANRWEIPELADADRKRIKGLIAQRYRSDKSIRSDAKGFRQDAREMGIMYTWHLECVLDDLLWAGLIYHDGSHVIRLAPELLEGTAR